MHIQDLDTPCAVVDLDVMENNLRRCQTYLDRHGLNLRPHIKTHKIPEFAHLQVRTRREGRQLPEARRGRGHGRGGNHGRPPDLQRRRTG